MNVVEPCVLDDMPEGEYHADPCPEGSLSNSGAKLILRTPAHFRAAIERPVFKSAFEFGKAAHSMVLGVGAPVVTVPADLCAKNGAWSTTDAKAFVAEQQAAGVVVLKPEDLAVVEAMATALAGHPIVRKLFADGPGRPERSLFWRDEDTRVMLRARLDWTTRLPSGRPAIVDYKTTARSADPYRFAWEARDFDYHMQDHHYREGERVLTGEDPAFLFVVQEKTAPYLVSVCEMDNDMRAVGAQRHRVARRLYLDCRTRDQWPGYAPVVHTLSAPPNFAPEPVGDESA